MNRIINILQNESNLMFEYYVIIVNKTIFVLINIKLFFVLNLLVNRIESVRIGFQLSIIVFLFPRYVNFNTFPYFF